MKTTKFQIIILIVFIAFIITGVVMFATYKGNGSSNQLPAITIWGTFPKAQFDQILSKVNSTAAVPLIVNYAEQTQDNFLNAFIAALARGNGPDAVLVPADLLVSIGDKLTTIPYDSYPQRDFVNSFVDEARVYLGPNGLTGVPFSIDPLVMYWNRDSFNAAGIAEPPQHWDEFKELNKKLTLKADNGVVTKSAIAMGDFSNVTNARELLGSLIMQTGNPVTYMTDIGVRSALSPSLERSAVPAVTFFTQFVDPSNENYSWNHSWPESRTAFIAGKLGTYFGLASELFQLRNKNPNLNFDVSPLPQLRTGGIATGYARLYGFSIVKQSRIPGAALQVIFALTSPVNLVQVSNQLYLPSVSRSIIASGSKDQYISIFNQSALIARTWLDADPQASSRILGNMTQAVTTGAKSIHQALTDTAAEYDVYLGQAEGGAQ